MSLINNIYIDFIIIIKRSGRLRYRYIAILLFKYIILLTVECPLYDIKSSNITINKLWMDTCERL